MNPLLRYIRTLVPETGLDVVSDRELLQRFHRKRDEAAFAALVSRYGASVWSACRRLLDRDPDAEDAFQAVFLILARKAGSTRSNCLPAWLHGVTRRVAANLRRQNRRRHRGEAALTERTGSPSDDPSWREVVSVLDDELGRMTENYRAVLILCCLEGKSRDEAAHQLGWSLGQVKGRLERARDLLRRRLSQRGIEFGSLLLTATLYPSVRATLPTTLIDSTVKAGVISTGGAAISTKVVLLSEGVLKTMLLTKIVTVGLFLFGIAGLSSVVLWENAATGQSIAVEKEKPIIPDALNPNQAKLPPRKADEPKGVALQRFSPEEPAPKQAEPPKKLSRVPETPAELQVIFAKWDQRYRHKSEEKFLELEAEAEKLLSQYPTRDDQARIYFQVAHIAGQSSCAKHYERINKYARETLERSRDPIQRGWAYMYLSCTAQEAKAAKTFPERRRLAAEVLLQNYVELLVQDLPEKAPELPVVRKVAMDFGEGLPPGTPNPREEQAAQIEARLEAQFIGELVSRRQTLLTQLRDLYRPSVYQAFRNADGPDELRALAAAKLKKPEVVDALLDFVTGPGRSTAKPQEPLGVKRINGELVLITTGKKHGLRFGDLLEVYRPGRESIYVGRLRVLAVDETEVIGKLTPFANQEVKVGDQATKTDASK